MATAADKNFMWSDEEINLLLHVVIDYKAGKAGEGAFAVNLTKRNKPGSKCNKNVSVFATQPGKT